MKIFLIAGLSGSGKSYLSQELAKHLVDVKIMGLDDFYIEGTERWEEPAGFNWNAIFEQILVYIKQQTRILIVDGIMSLYLYVLVMYFENQQTFTQLQLKEQMSAQTLQQTCNRIQSKKLNCDEIDNDLICYIETLKAENRRNGTLLYDLSSCINTVLNLQQKQTQEPNNNCVAFFSIIVETEPSICLQRRLQRNITFDGEEQYFTEQVMHFHNKYCKSIEALFTYGKMHYYIYKQ